MTARERTTRNTVVYGRWLLGAYAIFFAAVAPFVCWGTVDDPTHGHSGSHFIFDRAIDAATGHSSETHGHEYCSHDPMLRHNRLDPNRAAAAAIPDAAADEEGERSTPIITLISMIMLLLFGARETLFKQARQVITLHFFIPVKDVFLLVPIPPPRVSALSVI